LGRKFVREGIVSASSALSEDEQRRNWLLRFVGLQTAYDRKVIAALKHAEVEADKAVAKMPGENISSRVRRWQINLVRKEIKQVIRDLFTVLTPVIRNGQRDEAEAAMRAQLAEDAKVLHILIPNKDEREHWEEASVETARRGIVLMINRVTGVSPTYPLSRRVYRAGSLAAGTLDRQINSHIARGASHKELANAVSKSIKPSVPGGVSHAAMRLARTEIGNAYHAQSIGEYQDEPWVINVEWNLSGSHNPDPREICEQYADIGIFDKAKVPPLPHPNCMCYITPVLEDFSTLYKTGASWLLR
jgi:hypothetical protein